MDLKHFFEEPDKVIADLDEADGRLRNADAADGNAESFRLHAALAHNARERTDMVLGDAAASTLRPAASIGLGSVPGDVHRELLNTFKDANGAKREEMFVHDQIRLFSIVFALYRPGPAFGSGHVLSFDALAAKVAPGGESWHETLGAETLSAMTVAARGATRLDQQDGTQSGSGFLLANGMLLSARHVVLNPGWLFGNPPDPANRPAWVRYNRVRGAGLDVEASIAANGFPVAQLAFPDMAVITQVNDWRTALAASPLAAEFGSLVGFSLQETELSTAELKGRTVAVIAHPLSGNAGGDAADVAMVFGDAPLGTKRFMPGHLHADEPLVEEGGQIFLNHDCSTLGGASGGCVIDVTTGKVLGIHVSGHADTRNRAVPAWIVAPKVAGL